MDVTQILMLITILVYLAAMVGIGAVLAKQNQTTDDFYLADVHWDRSSPP